MCTALHCGLNGDEATARTRDSSLDEQQVGLGINLLNLQVLGGHAVVAHTRQSLDITDPRAVARAIAEAQPAVVINAAAFFNWANRLMLSLGEPELPKRFR